MAEVASLRAELEFQTAELRRGSEQEATESSRWGKGRDR